MLHRRLTISDDVFFLYFSYNLDFFIQNDRNIQTITTLDIMIIHLPDEVI